MSFPLNGIHQRDTEPNLSPKGSPPKGRVKIKEIIPLTKPKANILKIHSYFIYSSHIDKSLEQPSKHRRTKIA